MLIFTPLLGWIGIALAADVGCAPRTAPEDWAITLGLAETAFAELDREEFDADLRTAARDLPCLDAPLAPALAARYHRLIGLDHFIRGDEEGARLAFAAARAVDPLGVLPAAVLPQGNVARAVRVCQHARRHHGAVATSRGRPLV